MSEAIIADATTQETREFLTDLWRVCAKHGLMIDEFGIVVQMREQDYALRGYELGDEGELLPGKGRQ